MPKCQLPNCNNDVEKTKRGTWKMHCSVKCKVTHNSILGAEKRKQTCLKKYGSTSNLTHSDTKEKIKNKMIEKYGVEHPMYSNTIKEKHKTTVLETYGVDNVSKLNLVKEKKIQTYIKNFGTDHPLKSKDIQQKRKINSIAKYGVDHYSKTPEFKNNHPNQSHILPENFKKLKDPEWLMENSNYPCSYLAEMLGVTKDTVAKSYRRFGFEKDGNLSHGEISILEFIKEIYNGKVVQNSRIIIPPQEIDLFLPELNLAFEYNGIFWHSELNGKDKNYHLNKTMACREKGIRLIHIFENEWLHNRSIVESRISNLLGKSIKIYARSCNIVTLDTTKERLFFVDNHLQGYTPSTVCYGLEYDDEIVAAISFIRSRFNKKIKWELLRYANKIGNSVVGGASKLFVNFVKTYNPESVISYSDLRWNTGNLYKSMGFTFDSKSDPNYRYTKNYNLLESRIMYQKHKLKNKLENFNPHLTEWENMQAHGYDRIWDCGNDVWIWRNIN